MEVSKKNTLSPPQCDGEWSRETITLTLPAHPDMDVLLGLMLVGQSSVIGDPQNGMDALIAVAALCQTHPGALERVSETITELNIKLAKMKAAAGVIDADVVKRALDNLEAERARHRMKLQ
jgi:hypothetical protein